MCCHDKRSDVSCACVRVCVRERRISGHFVLKLCYLSVIVVGNGYVSTVVGSPVTYIGGMQLLDL